MGARARLDVPPCIALSVDCAISSSDDDIGEVLAVEQRRTPERAAVLGETVGRQRWDQRPVVGGAAADQRRVALEHAIDQAHADLFRNDCFPSAKKCATCHPQHFREWSVSPHAYGQLSPVFNAMSNKINELTSGTLGDFCIRCHTPVGIALNEPVSDSNLNRHPTSREGVTCVVCHRINQAWGKGAGRQALVPGDLHQAVYGPLGNSILEDVLADPDQYGVLKSQNDREVRGRDIHAKSHRFFQLTTSGSCGACHDVFAPNGFRLEDAFSEHKQSPSARIHGHSCQDCHMGKVPCCSCVSGLKAL